MPVITVPLALLVADLTSLSLTISRPRQRSQRPPCRPRLPWSTFLRCPHLCRILDDRMHKSGPLCPLRHRPQLLWRLRLHGRACDFPLASFQHQAAAFHEESPAASASATTVKMAPAQQDILPVPVPATVAASSPHSAASVARTPLTLAPIPAPATAAASAPFAAPATAPVAASAPYSAAAVPGGMAVAPAPAAMTPSAPGTGARHGSGGEQAAHSSMPSASQGTGNEHEAAKGPDVPGPVKSTATVANDSTAARQTRELPGSEAGSASSAASSSQAEAKHPASSSAGSATQRPRAECRRTAFASCCEASLVLESLSELLQRSAGASAAEETC